MLIPLSLVTNLTITTTVQTVFPYYMKTNIKYEDTLARQDRVFTIDIIVQLHYSHINIIF